MDVKDLQPVKAPGIKTADSSRRPLQRALSDLTANKVDSTRNEPVALEVNARTKQTPSTEARQKANTVINALNLVGDATQEIDSMVESLAGIAEQAGSGALSENRLAVLEQEAADLVNEIKRKAETPDPGGNLPLNGDPIRLELEKELGKTLEVILPDDTKDAFGLNDISLSPADNIIRTRANIEGARQRLEALKEAVDRSKIEVKQVVDTIDVALQNTEASSSSVRDVDQALKLSSKIGGAVNANPDEAVQVSNITAESLELLG